MLLVAKLMIAGSSGQTGASFEGPLKILQKRYASGEIDKDEYENMKKELEK